MQSVRKSSACAGTPVNTGTKLHIVNSAQSDAPTTDCELRTGMVTACHEGAYTINLASKQVSARRAAGCLLAPQKGDRVLLLNEQERHFHILNVLERESSPATLDFEHEVRLQAPKVSILGDEQIALQGGDLRLHGVSGSFAFLRCDLAAKDFRTRIHSVTASVVSVAQRVVKSLRIVGEERVRARRQQTVVKGRWSMHAEDAEMTADNDVKVDGEHVLLG